MCGGDGLGRIRNMTYKMNEFTSISQDHVTKLREAGIENTDDMLRLWAEPNRDSLVTKTGIDMKRFTEFASMSRLARVKNVGPKYVEVLLAAGIDGPKSLFEFTPESLMKRLGEVMAEKKLTSPMPTLSEIGTWFVDAKTEVGAAV
jgi:hypothetical protein